MDDAETFSCAEINQGKPFRVERLNIDGQEEIARSKSKRGVVLGILLSSSTFNPKEMPNYLQDLQNWGGRVKAQDADALIDKFVEINKDFFPGAKVAAQTQTPQASDTSSVPSSVTPSNMSEESSVTKQ